MCGRFDCHTPLAWVAEDYSGVTRPIESQTARYNIAPGKAISTVRRSGDDIDLNLMRWGFRPSWAVEDAPRPINARAEKVANSRFFSHAFQHKRCLVPANGWFEWMATEQGKQPYYITDPTLGDREVLFFAGIYSGSVEAGFSVAILTEPAAPNLRHIHDRQPVVVDPDAQFDWINPDLSDRKQIRERARRLDPEMLQSWPVSVRMNKPDYDDPSIIEPLARKTGQEHGS